MIQLIHIWLFAIFEIALPRPSVDIYVRPAHGNRFNNPSNRATVHYVSAKKRPWPTLAPPTDFQFIAGGELGKSMSRDLVSELAMKWSPVIGARTYAVQFCESKQCRAPSTNARLRGFFGEEKSFRDLAIVAGTTYLAWGLFRGKQYWFRVAGIDAQGQRGEYSSVLIGSAP